MESVEEYLARGGAITKLPGFTEIKPLPPHRNEGYKTEDEPMTRPGAKGRMKAPDGYYTMHESADALGMKYSTLLRRITDATCKERTIEGHPLPHAKWVGKMMVLPKGAIDEIARKIKRVE